MTSAKRLETQGVWVRRGGRDILRGLDIAFPDGDFTIIVGPNACGKSTLLRSLARLQDTTRGTVLLEGRPIASFGHRERARLLGVLPQSSEAPEGVTVVDLVARGRHPHTSLLRPRSSTDYAAVRSAMELAGVAELADRRLDELSGGQRQKAWIAMALAQETELLLLDEPTTYLDIAHQIEIMELCRRLHRAGRTIVAVLHDLNHACRYAGRIVAMRNGEILAQGPPQDVVTAELVEAVFGIACTMIADPVTGAPMVVPGRRENGASAV